MIPVINPWAPGFLRSRLGQIAPSITPSGPSITEATVPAPTSKGPGILLGVGGALVVLAVGSVYTLFAYGVASESKSKTVKATGYILAAMAGLATLVEAGSIALVGASLGKK